MNVKPARVRATRAFRPAHLSKILTYRAIHTDSLTSPAFEPANFHCLTSRRGIHIRPFALFRQASGGDRPTKVTLFAGLSGSMA